jgi:hypothetical protein
MMMMKDFRKIKVPIMSSCVILCLAFAVIGTLPVQNPLEVVQAQGQQEQETFFESAVRTANDTTSASQEQQQESTGDPILNNNFVRQGQISSQLVQLREEGPSQSAVVLPLRGDKAMYSGIITYQASRPVEAIVLNLMNPGNRTAIPAEFGSLDDIINMNGELVSVNEIGSAEAGSFPFAGNAIGFISEDEPFIVTYSLSGVPEQGRIVNDISSMADFNATSSDVEGSEGENEEEEEEDEN